MLATGFVVMVTDPVAAAALVARATPLTVTPWPLLMQTGLVNVPMSVAAVALVVRVNTLLGLTAELVIVRVGVLLEVSGAPEKVPTDCAVVALVVSVNVFAGDELMIVSDVVEKGGLKKLPVSCAAVASVFSVKVFAGLVLVTVMLLALVKVAKLVGASRLEKLPVLVAGVGGLAVSVIDGPPLVIVAVWVPSAMVNAETVPVWLASVPVAVKSCELIVAF